MNKPAVAAAALVVQYAAVAYSMGSLGEATLLMSVLVVPFCLAVAIRGHVGTTLVLAFAAWSVVVAAVASGPSHWIAVGWFVTAFWECVIAAVGLAAQWLTRRAKYVAVGDRPDDLLVERALSGEFED